MQVIKAYADGILHVQDTTHGFECSIHRNKLPMLRAALDYAYTMDPLDEPSPAAVKRGPRRGQKVAAPEVQPVDVESVGAAAMPAPPTPPKLPSLRSGSNLSSAILAAAKQDVTLEDLVSRKAVTSCVASEDPARIRTVVAAAITKLMKAGQLTNTGDSYKAGL
jgi:hypothetical protein